MAVSEQRDLAIAWLQGFLRAFAWFNQKADHGYTFSLDVIPKSSSVEEAIERHFRGEMVRMKLTPVAGWPEVVRGLLARWLFQFQDPRGDHLEDPRRSFSLSHEAFRPMFWEEVMGRLASAVQPEAVWRVEVQTRGWYECDWDDIAFEERDWVVFLHLGVSD
jgi:hypothetical protein